MKGERVPVVGVTTPVSEVKLRYNELVRGKGLDASGEGSLAAFEAEAGVVEELAFDLFLAGDAVGEELVCFALWQGDSPRVRG